VILIGKDGGEKLNSRTPVGVEQLKQMTDPLPMHRSEMQPGPQGEE
jgi:hypothetical protein